MNNNAQQRIMNALEEAWKSNGQPATFELIKSIVFEEFDKQFSSERITMEQYIKDLIEEFCKNSEIGAKNGT